jgi:L,D-peptidoglycan transpeptidase YkuD (ErfK/YbiS/YcfS/YnhG family)
VTNLRKQRGPGLSKARKGRGKPKVETRLRRIVATALPRFTPDAPARGRLHAGQTVFTCALGATAISTRKREGDHASPAGHFRLIEGFFKPLIGRRPRTALPIFAISRELGWCDDPLSGNYNRLIRLPAQAHHETLWREDSLYDLVIVLDYNLCPRRKGAGSAIFLHCARPGFTPTEGCVALRQEDLRKLLPRLARHAILIVQR